MSMQLTQSMEVSILNILSIHTWTWLLLFIFLKFPPCKVRFSDLYPDLLYKFMVNIPTLTDSAGHNFHRIFKVSMPKRPWER